MISGSGHISAGKALWCSKEAWNVTATYPRIPRQVWHTGRVAYPPGMLLRSWSHDRWVLHRTDPQWTCHNTNALLELRSVDRSHHRWSQKIPRKIVFLLQDVKHTCSQTRAALCPNNCNCLAHRLFSIIFNSPLASVCFGGRTPNGWAKRLSSNTKTHAMNKSTGLPRCHVVFFLRKREVVQKQRAHPEVFGAWILK